MSMFNHLRSPIISLQNIKAGFLTILLVLMTTLVAKSEEVYKTQTRLNIRTTPSVTAPIAGVLAEGQTIEIKNFDNGWAEINHNNHTCYVAAEYLIPVSSNKTDDSNSSNIRIFSSISLNWLKPFLNGEGKNNIVAFIAIFLVMASLIIMKVGENRMSGFPFVATWFLSMICIATAFYFQDFGIDNFVVYAIIMVALAYIIYREWDSFMTVMLHLFDYNKGGVELATNSFVISGLVGGITAVCNVWDWSLPRWVHIVILLMYLVLFVRYFMKILVKSSLSHSLCMLPIFLASNFMIYIVSSIIMGIAIPLIIVCLVVYILGSGGGAKDSGMRPGRKYIQLSNGVILDVTESMCYAYDLDGHAWKKAPYTDEWYRDT